MKPLRVLVDLDGTIVDTLPVWLREYHFLSGEKVLPHEITSYGFGQFVKNERLFFATLELGQVFLRAEPMPGALEALRFLRSQGHVLHFLTYNHEACRSGFLQKLDWLQHYNVATPDEVTFQKIKEFTDGDILIEDSPDNMRAWLLRHPEGRGILVAHLYNQEFEHPRCVRTATIFEGLRKLGVIK